MTGAVEHFDSKIGMDNQAITGAEAIEKGEGFAVTAHHDVLSVIDKIAGRVISEGAGAPTEGGLALEQRNSEARIREGNPRAQASDTATYDDDIPPLYCHRLAAEAEACARPRAAHEI
jgi:hypothetical protein